MRLHAMSHRLLMWLQTLSMSTKQLQQPLPMLLSLRLRLWLRLPLLMPLRLAVAGAELVAPWAELGRGGTEGEAHSDQLLQRLCGHDNVFDRLTC